MYGQFSFLALNKKSDWDQGLSENLVHTDQGISLMKNQQYGLQRMVMFAETGITNRITNICSAQFGLLYLLDAAANIWTYDFLNQETTLLLKEGHGLFGAGASLFLSKSTLFLLDYDQLSITALSSTNGQVMWTNSEFYGGYPLTAVVDDNENLLVVTGKNLLFDQSNKVQMEVLSAALDGRVSRMAAPYSFSLAAPNVRQHGNRVKAALSNRSLYVLDTFTGFYWIFNPGGRLAANSELGLERQVYGLAVDSDGSIYTSADFDSKGNKHILQVSAGNHEPAKLISYQGNVDDIWLDRNNRIYIWNKSNCSLSILEREDRVKLDQWGKTRGTYIFPVMDSTTPEIEWHRISLNADIPDDTQIRLSYFSSDSKEFVIDGHLINLERRLQDQDITWEEKLTITEPLWSKEIINPRDALLISAQGRYLWLKIQLIGSDVGTPLLRRVRIYFPRMSLLSYLPAVYQQDTASRSFLERFLSLFDTFLQGMEEQIDQVSRMFDPEVVSGPFLNWLASWLDLTVDENWTEEQIRSLLMAAPSLFKKRGTREGMEQIITIYTGEKPLIVEYFQYKYLQEIVEIKDLMSRLYGQNPYSFAVLVNQDRVAAPEKLLTLQKIIDAEKPAFTEAKLVVLQPWMYMDMHTYLGINTYLSELSLLRLDNKASMPFSSVIVDKEQDNSFDTYTRMEMDARLK